MAVTARSPKSVSESGTPALRELYLGAHGHGTFRGHRPELCAPAVPARPSPQLEGRRVEEGGARLSRVRAKDSPGTVIAREVDEERGGERSVHHEPRIAFDVHGPGAIVV